MLGKMYEIIQFKAFFSPSPFRGYSPKMMLQILNATLLEDFSYMRVLSAFHNGSIFLQLTKTCCKVSEFSFQILQLSEELI